MKYIAKLFLDHPRSVGESYFEHMAFAFKFSMRLFGGALAALTHAFLPFMFEKTASTLVKNMAQKMNARNEAEQVDASEGDVKTSHVQAGQLSA